METKAIDWCLFLFLGGAQIKAHNPMCQWPLVVGGGRLVIVVVSHIHTRINKHKVYSPACQLSVNMCLSASPVAANHQALFNAIKEDVNTALLLVEKNNKRAQRMHSTYRDSN